jgi:cytochrome c-type biogenesis protein CcmH
MFQSSGAKAMTKQKRYLAMLTLAAVAALVSGLVYAQGTDRAKRVGGGLMCMCNCNEILTQCNHVGCTMSATMIKELDQRVQTTSSDDLLLQSFVQEYGPKVLASPPAQGFNLLAWAIPAVAFGGGLTLVVMVIRQWRRRFELAPAGGPPVPISAEALERARRQVDRETED